MKKEYMNPSMLTIEVDANVDTIKVSNTGEGNEKTNNEGNDILGFEVSYDTVDSACNNACKNLDKYSCDKGKGIIGAGKSGFLCHNKISFFIF